MRQRQSGQEGRQSCRVCNVCLVRTVPARCFFRRSQKSGVRCNLLQALRSSGTSRPTRAVFAVVRHLAQKKGSSKTPGCSVAGKGTDDMSKIGEHVRWELLRKPSSRSVWLAKTMKILLLTDRRRRCVHTIILACVESGRNRRPDNKRHSAG